MSETRLSALADAVAGDAPLNWVEAELSVSGADQAVVRQLQVLASVSQVSRSLTLVWGPFELRERVGEGSFGVVYRAWDRRLNRPVALKLLHDGMAGTTWQDGIIHEARLLAAVDHPNVVSVYGADVHAGRVGIWMKYIEGDTLKAILLERGPFSADEAAGIGRSLCGALAAVHRAGVVHRDIKAQNVMRETGGRIILMDFGAGDSESAARNTSLKGAPAYLAPEVILGEAPPTAHSDIYSVGVLLFHLVSGEFPVTASSWDELKRRHAEGARASLRDVRPDTPDWFVQAVNLALAPVPADRPATAGTLAALLSAPVADQKPARAWWNAAWLRLLLIVTAVAGAAAVWQSASGTVPSDVRPILATGLALRSVVPEGASESMRVASAALLDGLSHGLRRDLGIRIPTSDTLHRLARLSDEALVSATRTGGLLTVTVTPAGSGGDSGLNVSLKLASAAAGWPTVFSGSVQGPESEVASLAARAIREIGRAVGNDLPQQPTPSSPPRDYSLGRFFAAKLTEPDLLAALGHYDRSIEERPEFAPAYAARSEATVLLYGNHGTYSAVEALTRALADARRAIDIDPTLPGGHTALAWASYYVGWDWPAAEAAFRLSIAADPRDGVARHLYADFLTAMGRPTEALEQEREALESDPASLRFNRGIGWIHFFAGDFAAAAALEYTLTLDPGYEHARTLLARAYSQMGMHERALSEIRRVVSGNPSAGNMEVQAHVLAQAGQREEAVQMLRGLSTQGRDRSVYTRPYFSALVWSALGDTERALDELERAFAEHDSTLVNLRVDPRLQPLHSEPRFAKLCQRLRLS